MLTRKLITGPVVEPVTLDEALAHLRLSGQDIGGDRQAQIQSLISAARQHFETIANRALITQTWEMYCSEFPGDDCIYLPFGNLQAVTVFEWTDAAGVNRSWTPDGADLKDGGVVMAHINTVEEPGEIELAHSINWPSDTLKTSNPIRIRFTCGYGATGASVPMPIKQALLLLIEHYDKNTSAVFIGQDASISSSALAMGFDHLTTNYRLFY